MYDRLWSLARSALSSGPGGFLKHEDFLKPDQQELYHASAGHSF